MAEILKAKIKKLYCPTVDACIVKAALKKYHEQVTGYPILNTVLVFVSIIVLRYIVLNTSISDLLMISSNTFGFALLQLQNLVQVTIQYGMIFAVLVMAGFVLEIYRKNYFSD